MYWFSGTAGILTVVLITLFQLSFGQALWVGAAVLAVLGLAIPRPMERWASFPPRALKSIDLSVAIIKSRAANATETEFTDFVTAVQNQIRICHQAAESRKPQEPSTQTGP